MHASSATRAPRRGQQWLEWRSRRGVVARCILLAAAFVVLPVAASAYIGPGAGFTLLTSSMVLLTTIVVVGATLLAWPFRAVWRLLRYGKPPKPWVRRMIVVGFDGQDPKLTDRFMSEGKLPNFAKLAQSGCYKPLRTTIPSISPVAWSSFCTGTQPAKHNIFDFLGRDRNTYQPLLSSTHIGKVKRKLRIGRLRLPLGRPPLRLLRRSKPFWTVLGENRVWSTILRVPITFPPDNFHGAQLSAMCAPDLLGTQGSFLLYTTRTEKRRFKEGGIRIRLPAGRDHLETAIHGPGNDFLAGQPPLKLPMKIRLHREQRRVTVRVGDVAVELAPGELSPWLRLQFRALPWVTVQGVCRMQVMEMDEHFSLYVTPINLDPEKPAMPVSHPPYYASYLAKKIGTFATLGLAEDTWALNEDVIDEETFLQQAYSIDRERQDMFFAALDRLRRGCLVCVFDATDRIQHMFWHHIDPGHPAAQHRGDSDHADAIERIYRHNDALVGRLLQRLQDGDVLVVLSDHGFTSFRRGVNLNAWLARNGYLALLPGSTGTSEWLADVDWSRTRAYSLGLSGVFLNVAGREAQGIVVRDTEAAALKAELVAKLTGLVDDEAGCVAINEVFDSAQVYQGPYLENAPDLVIGYNAGYRVSWDGATGIVAGPVFEDNVKAWSGDHCVDPRLVPGVFFCTRRIERDDPALIDIAPTALRLFGLEPPPYMEGRSLFEERGRFDGATRADGGPGIGADGAGTDEKERAAT
jgi:predicted AlkP superfamily phosphohydrolase/phosphomutase